MEHFVIDLSTIKAKQKMQVELKHHSILLIYTNDNVYALQDKCPHMGIPLFSGTVKDNVIKCKDHGLPISVETGNVTSKRQAEFLRLDQYSKSVKTYHVIVKDDAVYIELP